MRNFFTTNDPLDKIIEKTSFEMKGIAISEFEENGTMRVKGKSSSED